MLLTGRTAIIYGGGGTLGGAIASAFAKQGAILHLVGRSRPRLDAVAKTIESQGGQAYVATFDAGDLARVDEHAASTVAKHGRLDISVNAVGIAHVQGTPLASLSYEDFNYPIAAYMRTNFATAKAAARHMTKQGSGVLLTISNPGARVSGVGVLGNNVACAGLEAFTRNLAAEVGEYGVRALCLRPHAIPEAVPTSYTGPMFSAMGEKVGESAAAFLAETFQPTTLLKRLPTLEQVASAAVFAASDGAGAMTGTVINLTCGTIVD
jgi:3-oxoacyl-[acyl-carrier protein] reductase